MAFPWPGKKCVSLAEIEEVSPVKRRVLLGMIARGEVEFCRVGKCYFIARADAFRIICARDPEDALPPMPPRRVLSPEAAALDRSLGW